MCSETKKVLDLSLREYWLKSRREYWLKNISILENHMQVIRNQREASGRADDMKATMNELQERKDLFEELLYPKVWWNCAQCTYLNSPIHFECKMCESQKPAEITVAMSASLKALLSNREDDEKEITCLFTSVEEETPETLIKKQERKITELVRQHDEVSERHNELEANNTKLVDKITEVKTTLKTCVDLSVVDPKEWTVPMVSVWLLQLGVWQYQQDFKDACIDGETLLSCNEMRLEELDVRKKHRPLILSAIADLKTKRKQLNLSGNLSSVQSQLTNAVCETQNVQELPVVKTLKLPRKPLEAEQPISCRISALENKDDCANFSDAEWDNSSVWNIVVKRI